MVPGRLQVTPVVPVCFCRSPGGFAVKGRVIPGKLATSPEFQCVWKTRSFLGQLKREKPKPQTCREGHLLFYTEHQCRHIRLCPVRAKLTAPANDAGFRTAETISVHRGGFSKLRHVHPEMQTTAGTPARRDAKRCPKLHLVPIGRIETLTSCLPFDQTSVTRGGRLIKLCPPTYPVVQAIILRHLKAGSHVNVRRRSTEETPGGYTSVVSDCGTLRRLGPETTRGRRGRNSSVPVTLLSSAWRQHSR
ncbi:hypothetical protein Bbelb_142710 [Branchiostoma belcheri]|nr:hypothetical protein Bbelb_142710 [Branchiostoma belcheri]